MTHGKTIKKKRIKPKKCKWCKEMFEPVRPLQDVCSPNCALQKIRHKNRVEQERKRNEELKVERAEIRQRKLRVKPRSYWANRAQSAVNKYIRTRDAHLPCISCGATESAQWDAGHYRTRAAAPQLRFHEDNIHRQCVVCNKHKSGNIVPYRVELIKRIGIEKVEALESNHKRASYTVEQLQEVEQQYKLKLKAIQKG